MFAKNLKQLPGVSHLSAIELFDGEEKVGVIENKTGQTGSLTVFNYLAQLYGAITPEAAKRGLELYAEHTEEAHIHPGKHPNIDRLIDLTKESRTLRVKHVFATAVDFK